MKKGNLFYVGRVDDQLVYVDKKLNEFSKPYQKELKQSVLVAKLKKVQALELY